MKDRFEAARTLFHRGEFGPALSAAVGGAAPRDRGWGLLEAFFPNEDGRQDLINWLSVRRAELAPRRPAFVRALRVLRRRGGPRLHGELAGLGAYCCLFLGRFDEAAALAARASAAPPSYWRDFLHAVCLWQKAAQDRSRRLLPSALKLIEAAIDRDPGNPYGYYVRGALRREFEDVGGRLADAETLIRLRPDFVWARIERAEILGETRRYAEARVEIDRLIRRFPRQAWPWAQRARLNGIYGRLAPALADFERALARDPRCGPIYAWRGEAWRRAGRYARALADFDRSIRLDPSYRLPYAWRGRVRLMLGLGEDAIADLRRALELEPREELAAGWLAEALWKTGRRAEAARLFDRLHPAEPGRTWNRRVVEGRGQGRRFVLRGVGTAPGRDAAFWNEVDSAARLRPRDPWVLAFRGRALVSAGRLSEAAAELARALALRPALAYARRWRGEALRRMGRPREALVELNRAARLAPSERWTRAFRAFTLAQLGRTNAAEADFTRALRRSDHRVACVLLWRSRWRHGLGRREEARADAAAAFSLDGKDPRTLAWLEELRREPTLGREPAA